MNSAAEIIEAANALAELVEAKRPVTAMQARRDRATVTANRRIQKLARDRFRKQRASVLASSSLEKLHVAINRASNRESRISERSAAYRPGSSPGGESIPHGNRSGALRETHARPRGSSRRPDESDSGSASGDSRRVTGSVDAPLTDRGREQARELRDRIGEIAVYTAPNARSRETGSIIGGNAQDAEWLRPWGVGKYEGMTLDDARDAINRLIVEAPDESPGASKYSGRIGDTFNEVAARLINGAAAQREELPASGSVLNVTSGRAIHIIHAAARKQFQSIDKDELTQNSDFSKPGDLFELCSTGMYRRHTASGPGQYFVQHGETDWNEGVAASESLREAADDKDRISEEVAAAIGAEVYGVPVTAAEEETYVGAIRQAIDSGAAGAAELLSVTAPSTESFIAEYLKDGGFTRLTGQIDKTTVDRIAAAVADAYESGADFDGTVSVIRSAFSDMSIVRAKMIAQTELNDAFNQSIVHFGTEAGATRKSWETDAAPCAICVDNALQGEIGIDEDFDSGDDAPPAHPNCLCSLLVHADN